ncbi:hypothetical protein GCM10010123_07050 [Pilimelia anulata]|uniref:DUF4097 domain-containing protein n=1 Tax=Pilimelia anulata TaxID=53371 RepID=A0A8J3B2A0_9ACTN|nr:DUF4097 family beta strand repeat-containing protein [Pilimelia anulata]GGJ79829.1 hypothetical protein GCM10010123_07050 [Pilimelia anulata]
MTGKARADRRARPAGERRRPSGLRRRIVGAVAGVLALAALGGCGLVPLFDRHETREQTYAGPITRLLIDTDGGDLAVRAGTGPHVTVRRRLTWSGRRPVLTERQADGALEIRARCASRRSCSVDHVVEVPAGIAVHAGTDAGDVRTTGLTGEQWITTDSGDVRIGGAAGPVAVRVDSGSIVADALTAPTVDAATDAGDIRLLFAAAPRAVSGRTDSGDIDVGVPPVPGGYRVDAATDAGDRSIAVENSPASGRTIAVRTDSGDIGLHATA